VLQSGVGLSYRTQESHKAEDTQRSADYSEAVRPYGGIRGFFSGDSSAPLSAQIGAIVIASAVAAIRLFVGVSSERVSEVRRGIYL